MFVDDAVRFQAKLLARGFQGEKVVVRLKELEPGSRDPKTARELESTEVDAPANGQPKRVELVYRPKTTGERTFILEVDPRPRELQTDNNRIERAITVRKEKLKVLYVDTEPRYEFRYLKNYLERDETIDLNIVLLSSDPAYSQQDRSALPTFPAAKDDLFAYDVVLFGDADTSFLSQSQMQNLVEFVTEKGGGVLFIAGELFNPLSYRGTPLELLLPIELADARNPTAVGTSVNSFRPELTLEGRASPIFRFGDNEAVEHADLGAAPRALLVLRGPAQEAGGTGPGRTSHGHRLRRQAAPGPLPVRRRGQGDVPCVRRHLALAFSRRRQVFRAVLGPDGPVPGAIEAGRPAPGRGPDRPQALSARTADPAPGPLPQSRPGTRQRRRHRPGRKTRARPAQAGSQARARNAERLRRRTAASRRGGLRGPAPAPARSSRARSPRPASASTRRSTNSNASK